MSPLEPDNRANLSLMTLPDGNDRYLTSLITILTWIEQSENPSREAFIRWAISHWQGRASEGSAANYWQFIARLGYREDGNPPRLSEAGHELLHCSPQERAEKLFTKLHTDFKGVASIAHEFYKHADHPFHLDALMDIVAPSFPEWNSKKPFEDVVHWLASLGYITACAPRTHQLTDFGRHLAENHTAIRKNATLKRLSNSYGRKLIIELMEAARDSQNSEHFEKVLETVFKFLGFDALHDGVRGNTDVIANCLVPDGFYRVILDAKSRKDGKLNMLIVDSILDHKTKAEADFAVVVAERFADGNLIRHAREHGVVLLPVELLCQWIMLHCECPMDPLSYQPFFKTPGLVKEIPDEVQTAVQQFHKTLLLMDKLIESGERYAAKHLQVGASIDSWDTALTLMTDQPIVEADLLAVVDLFTHPMLGWGRRHKKGGMFLAANRATIILKLRRMAQLLEQKLPKQTE